MLRSRLRDAAIEAAKAYMHEEVEPRHVLFAAARQFRERPEIGERFQRLKDALEPRGDSLAVPALSEESERLLETFSTPEQVVDALLAHLGVERGGDGGAAGATSATRTEAGPPAHAAAPQPPAAETVADVLAELDLLIGLAAVKRQVRNLLAVVQANQERTRAGLSPVSPGLHLVFTGPPGTGKTTVARIIGRLYAATGALPGANFTEASRADLVAGYVGQTALKTAEVIRRTRPGVLFIDEAYALAPTHDSDFGAEAIATLVKSMEDHRGELAIIAAGYGDEMGAFIGSNPGLKSRFKTYIDFPDYAPDELGAVFESFARSVGIGLGEGTLERAQGIFARAALGPDFGNARFARSLFEQGYARMAARALADGEMTLEELTMLEAVDLEWEDQTPDRGGRALGFRSPGGG